MDGWVGVEAVDLGDERRLGDVLGAVDVDGADADLCESFLLPTITTASPGTCQETLKLSSSPTYPPPQPASE